MTSRAAYFKAWRARNLERRLEYDRAYRFAHKEELNEKQRARYEASPERATARVRRRQADHPDHHHGGSSPEVHRQAQARYAAAHPDRRSQNDAHQRARRMGASGSHTFAEWREKVELFGGCCAYCGRDDVKLGREHMVPLSRGGSDDIANIVPACGPCNSKKRTRTASEFLAA